MASNLDPYRTLGLAQGASLDEVRRAYRKLVKTNHPDSAGEAALPRFLAIQAAYEMLTEGRARSARVTGRPTGSQPAAGEASRADPTRARATRDAYSRARRSGAAGGSASAGPAAGAAPGSSGSRARSAGAGERPRSGGGRGSRKKATLGSTSYDAAEDEPFEPEWSGGTWYGAASGTYWTLNPKEYADPRKHGPEYQRRARRRLDGVEPEAPDDDATFSGEGFETRGTETDAGGAGHAPGRDGFDGRWTYPDDTDAGGPAGDDPDVIWMRQAPDAPPARPSLQDAADQVLDGRVGFGARLVLAWFGSVPIVALIAWLAGEISGCGRFTASCADPSGLWALATLAITWAFLAAVPRLAAVSAAGLLGSLAISVPATVILSAGGGSRQPEASTAVLTALIVVGYVIGVALAVARKLGWRRVPSA
jgi:curved DNA-binding protein CbpA